jgi:hypothetical protein
MGEMKATLDTSVYIPPVAGGQPMTVSGAAARLGCVTRAAAPSGPAGPQRRIGPDATGPVSVKMKTSRTREWAKNTSRTREWAKNTGGMKWVIEFLFKNLSFKSKDLNTFNQILNGVKLK